MSRLSRLESEHAKDGERLEQLDHNLLVQAGDIRKLSDENQKLKDTVQCLGEENASLKAENQLLRDDNERMKRILNNNSGNSSMPPSTDQRKASCQTADDTPENEGDVQDTAGRSANKYNGRTKTNRKKVHSRATGAVQQQESR